jgi:hypothetical protein
MTNPHIMFDPTMDATDPQLDTRPDNEKPDTVRHNADDVLEHLRWLLDEKDHGAELLISPTQADEFGFLARALGFAAVD